MAIPPPEKDRFPYPTDTVVAIADDDAAVTEALRRLEAVGIDDDRVDRLQGPDGAERIDPDGSAHGAAGEHKRRVQQFWGDDAAHAQEYAGQLRGGSQLLAVSVVDREQAQLAGTELRQAGLTAVRYFSRHFVESL